MFVIIVTHILMDILVLITTFTKKYKIRLNFTERFCSEYFGFL